MPEIKKRNYFLAAASLLIYVFIGYFIQRNESIQLISSYAVLFLVYLIINQTARIDETKFWIYISFVFRLSFLFAIPSLSDDFYRFIWDGRLLAHGIHPFAELPDYYLTHVVLGLDKALYDHLNSQPYFTVYPPLAQYIFMIATLVSPNSILGSVIVMRLFILAAELGTLILLWDLLPRINVNRKSILWYALNPLVILELTGNLHFEALIIFFTLLSLYFLFTSKPLYSSVSFALAICSKLLPVILLPQFFHRLGFRRGVYFYSGVVMVCILVSIPLLDKEIIDGFRSSLALYFRQFEFNASLYYLVREFGYWVYGYNIIQTVGWKLALISTFTILVISFWPFIYREGHFQLKKFVFPFSLEDSPKVMMWVLLTYFLFTTTLHPWYVTTLLMLSVFTPFRYVVVWSGLIFLTYTGYSEIGYKENLYIVVLEYVVVIGYLAYELIWERVSVY